MNFSIYSNCDLVFFHSINSTGNIRPIQKRILRDLRNLLQW